MAFIVWLVISKPWINKCKSDRYHFTLLMKKQYWISVNILSYNISHHITAHIYIYIPCHISYIKSYITSYIISSIPSFLILSYSSISINLSYMWHHNGYRFKIGSAVSSSVPTLSHSRVICIHDCPIAFQVYSSATDSLVNFQHETKNSNHQPHGFRTSSDMTIIRLTRYWWHRFCYQVVLQMLDCWAPFY